VLHDLLNAHRTELIDRCKAKTAKRFAHEATKAALTHGIPLFLDQIIRTLQIEQTAEPMQSRAVSGPSGGGASVSEIRATAMLHGRELLDGGYTIDQVVHDYGDLCQAITDLAFERNWPIQVDEFRTLNRCLDNGIADAVTEFASQRDAAVATRSDLAQSERLGSFAHDLRGLTQTAMYAVAAMKTGRVALHGATGAILDRSLDGLRNRIERLLADTRVTAGLPIPTEVVEMTDFVAQMKQSASLDALARECTLTVAAVEGGLEVEVDRDLLVSAVANLLQNAFKFTKRGTAVSLSARASGDRVLIEVADHCGGLPPGAPEKLFLPFTQRSLNRTGVGLGLSICRHNVEANNGILRVRDIPGVGCVFTIDLPGSARRS
jgi:signal transduction histidine kinase